MSLTSCFCACLAELVSTCNYSLTFICLKIAHVSIKKIVKLILLYCIAHVAQMMLQATSRFQKQVDRVCVTVNTYVCAVSSLCYTCFCLLRRTLNSGCRNSGMHRATSASLGVHQDTQATSTSLRVHRHTQATSTSLGLNRDTYTRATSTCLSHPMAHRARPWRAQTPRPGPHRAGEGKIKQHPN